MHAPEPNPHGPPGLRRVALFSFPLAVILFLCHFFSNLRPLPFLGLLPLGFSAAHSATTLYPVLRQVVPRVLPLSRSTHTPLLIDAILASVYLIVWPLSVSVISDDYYGTPVLGAYCTVFLIVVGAIHAYYAAYYVVQFVNEPIEHEMRSEYERKPQQADKSAQKSAEDKE